MSNPQQLHSKLSFSARHRWRVCGFSIHDVDDLPPDVGSPAAQEGTAAHLQGEWYVRQHFNIPFADGTRVGAGEAPDVARVPGLNVLDDAWPAWQDMLRKHGKDYRDFVRSLIPADEPDAYISVETKVDIKSIHPMLFGTLDLRIWLPKRHWLIIVDYKYGFQDVDIGTRDDPNSQLAAYAVASVEGLSPAARAQLAGITLAVYQPRVPMGDPRKLLELPVAWIDEERRKLRDEVTAVENPGAPRPGDHCRYCRKIGKCPAVHNVLETALIGYAGGRNILAMSDDEIIDLWSARKAVETLMEDVDERVRALAQKNHERLEIATRKGRKMWKDPKNAALTLLVLGRTDLLQPVALSDALPAMPPALHAELVGESRPGSYVNLRGKAPAPNVVRDMFSKYVEKA